MMVCPCASSAELLSFMTWVLLGLELGAQRGKLGFNGFGSGYRVELTVERVFARRVQQRAGLGQRIDCHGASMQPVDLFFRALDSQAELHFFVADDAGERFANANLGFGRGVARRRDRAMDAEALDALRHVLVSGGEALLF